MIKSPYSPELLFTFKMVGNELSSIRNNFMASFKAMLIVVVTRVGKARGYSY